MTIGTVPYTLGMRPASRTLLPGYDSGVLCLLIAVFLILAFNLRHCSTYIKNFSYDLRSVRRTDSTFTVRTFSETGIRDLHRVAHLPLRGNNNKRRPDLPRTVDPTGYFP